MAISKKRQYLNIGIVIILAVVIYIFKYPFTSETIAIDERGETDEQGFKQGTWEGYEDGTLIYRRNYVNDTLHGLSESYHKNGSIYTSANYNMGNFIDTVSLYFSNGQLNSFGIYDVNGKQYGEFKIYYENGQLSQVGNFRAGQLDGEILKYHQSGKLEAINYYEEGIKLGIWIEIDEHGDTTLVEKYANDELIRTIKSADNSR